MDKTEYIKIESHMLSLMTDSAHDKEHIYRVLYAALDISKNEDKVDKDILISACLLHDIGREKQFKNPKLCHAIEGGKMAYNYLLSIGWDEKKAESVKNAITTHRFRSSNPPQSTEAKILFDADKLDAAGTLGIARTLIYKGQVSDILYSTDQAGYVIDGDNDVKNTFFNEYKTKLENIYKRFYTKRGKEIAAQRQKSATDFWNALYSDVTHTHCEGIKFLKNELLIS